MSVVMLILGLLIALAGAAALGLGVWKYDFSVGHTMIMAGVGGLTGGVIAMGLSAVISRLTRIARALEAPPARNITTAAEFGGDVPPHEAAAPALSMAEAGPPESMEAPAATPLAPQAEPRKPMPEATGPAADRLRTSLAVTPRSAAAAPTEADDTPAPPVQAPPPYSAQNGAGHDPRVDFAADDTYPPAKAPKGNRLDFLFRSRAQRSTPNEPADPPRPRRGAREATNGSHPPPERAPAVQPGPAIIKSGVVDGMAYTLYADGSIEAQLPHGTVRFGSITELRAHIESNS